MQRLTAMIDGIDRYSSYAVTQANLVVGNKDEAFCRVTPVLKRCGFAET